MIEMKVLGLALDNDTQAPMLILRDAQDRATLSIWIGAMEAMAISFTLNDVKLPRPMTHDLLLQAIKKLGGAVRTVSITELRDGAYHAVIAIERDGALLEVDARPSDAVALALRAHAPILVAPQVLEVSSRQARPRPSGEDKWADILNKFTPDETKYKM